MIESFHFLRPYWFLAVVPLLWLLLRWHLSAKQQSAWRAHVDEALLEHVLVGGTSPVRRLPVVLLLLLWLLAVVALAGPSWEKQPAPVYRSLQERVIVVDLSRSMNAQDLKPSRLQRAKQTLRDILRQSEGSQTALIVFSAVPYVVSPLTDDVQTIQSMVPSLATDIVPVQGSRMSLALSKGIELLTQSNSRGGSIWMITDSAPDSGAFNVARDINSKGYRLNVIAVGSEEGAPVPDAPSGFVKDLSDNIVIAKLPLQALKDLAGEGGGLFSVIDTIDTDLGRLLNADVQSNDTGVEDLDRQTDLWLERGPFLVLLLLPLVALYFRRGVL